MDKLTKCPPLPDVLTAAETAALLEQADVLAARIRREEADPDPRLVPCPGCGLPPDVICGKSTGSASVGCSRCELGMFAKDKESAVDCWNHFCHGHV